MNLLILALVGIGTAALLFALGVTRRLGTIVGTALMLGATGFAVQSARHQPGKSVATDATPITVDPGMVAFRTAVFAPTPDDTLALASADGRLADGNPRAAAQGLARELALRPRDAVLWTHLGYVLALHDRGVSPAAKLAFRRALALGAGTPGPAFFLGMAQVDAGDLAAARPSWTYALSVAPRDAPYRSDIAERIAALDQLRRLAASQPAKR
jgi:cytochrome c-type biogenesis protein CcmH